MISYLNINENTRVAIRISKSYANEYRNEKLGVSHLLKALMHKDSGLHGFMKSIHKDIAYISEWAEVRISDYAINANKSDSDLIPDEFLIKVFEEADTVRLKIGLDLIDPICLLIALVKPNCGYTSEQLKSLSIRESEIMEAYISVAGINRAMLEHSIQGDVSVVKANTGALYSYCIDRNSKAKESKVDPVVGRDGEINKMIEILGRKNKPNVLLIGDPGVGKTVMIDGFVEKINLCAVPSLLKNCIVFELQIGSLLAGATYKGEVEDRFKKIIAELKSFEKAILFIDELHTIIDNKGSSGNGIANLLKPELARGELTIIGATTKEEFRKFIEPDIAFNRRFDTLMIFEPDFDTAVKMIQSLVPSYERHHGIRIGANVICDSVRLAKRYIKEKSLPDSALDLIDRTLAAVKLMNETSTEVIISIEKELDNLIDSRAEFSEDFLKELKWLHRSLINKISPVLLSQLENHKNISIEDDVLVVQRELEACIEKLFLFSSIKKNEITTNDILSIISNKTGIPIGKIQSEERDKLLSMESQLQKRVVGQDYAIKVLSDTIIESRSGINKQGQPIGAFFFLGPTGTGKTELTKAIAEFLFNDEKAMIRFDMSEFKEEHSAALLYGAPPGYVGYEEGGMLVNKIRQKPYSVVLFDEIEKAHNSVFDVFLQIMDEGTLHDKLGKEGDFSNAIIIFTSNIASDWVVEQYNNGIQPSSQSLMNIMTKNFRPEFLARISEIIPFAPISEEHVIRILEIQLVSLNQSLIKQGILFVLKEDAKKDISFSGFTPSYGARQLGIVIRNKLRKPIARMLVCGELIKGDMLEVDLQANGEMRFTVKRPNNNIEINEFETIQEENINFKR